MHLVEKCLFRLSVAGLAALSLVSCSAIFDSIVDSTFESSRDKNIRKNSRNAREGKPLEHYSSEHRLKVDREDRMFEDLRSQ